MSPGPNQSAARPWSSSRTPSLTDSSSPQIAGKGPRISSTSSSSSTAPASSRFSNPFARYESGYGLASRQTGAHDNASSPSIGITLPSIPSLSTVSNPTPPTTLAPSATALAPSLSGVATSALDTAVGLWIRGVISKESQWDAFVKNRARVLRMREQLEQYKYVQRVIDRYVGTTTPVDLEGAGGVTITKAQVMRAFNLSLAWGEDCTETLVMTTLYGPGGTRCEDARVCAMMEEEPPISTGIQAKKYLALLREVHGQWTVAHPDGL
ncbi:hypothetical protein C8Q79DRAFT_913026 [Trametes meyenii]|nr:hypothetical protein C8Q79DRAFT_913026 [Trametes meyenii]